MFRIQKWQDLNLFVLSQYNIVFGTIKKNELYWFTVYVYYVLLFEKRIISMKYLKKVFMKTRYWDV